MISIKRKKKSKKQNDWGTAWINKHFGLFLLSEAYPASFKSFLAFPKQIGSYQDQKFYLYKIIRLEFDAKKVEICNRVRE